MSLSINLQTWLNGSRLLGPGIFRIYLALIVILSHVSSVMLGGLGVFLFFVLSGYWISRMWREKYSHFNHSYLVFVGSRFWRLAPIYFVSVLVAVVAFTYAGFLESGRYDLGWWLKIAPIAFSWNFGLPLSPLWSLDVEFQFYLVLPLLFGAMLWLKSWMKMLVAGALCISTLYFLYAGIAYINSQYIQFCAYYLGFFTAGMWIEDRRFSVSNKVAFASLISTVLVLTCLLIVPATRESVIYESDANPQICGAFVAGVPVFFLLPFVAWILDRPSDLIDRKLGDLAYPLYALHMIPITFYNHYARGGSLEVKLVGIFLALLGSALLTLIVFWLVDQPLDAMRRRWLKNRTVIC